MPVLHKLTCVVVTNPDTNRFTCYTSNQTVIWMLIPVLSALNYSVTWSKLKSFEGKKDAKEITKQEKTSSPSFFDIRK